MPQILTRACGVAAFLSVAALATSAMAANPSEVYQPHWTRASDWDVANQYVVDFRDDVSATTVADVLRSAVRFWPTALEADTRIEIAEISGSTSAIMARLRADPHIEGVEPLSKLHTMFVPNDPLYVEQWHMRRVGAEQAWGFSVARGVTVAVVDTGIACQTLAGFTKATDLVNTSCVAGANFIDRKRSANDDHGHGTHVAGTIAQSTNNTMGAAGLAFHARLMPVKVLSSAGWGTNASVADGIRWAADNGAQVINLSLGGPRHSAVIQRAVEHAIERGVVVVAAAGNNGGPVGYPGACDGVIGVSASDHNDKLAWFSSRGKEIDLAAPGVDVLQQTICDGGLNKCEVFSAFNGTSMASPHVAAAAALLVGLGVNQPRVVEQILKDNAKPLGAGDTAREQFGAGLLQAGAAAKATAQKQLGTRLLALLALILLAVRWAKRRGGSYAATHPMLWLGGLFSGVGVLFFAPWFGSRQALWLDMLSRPLVEWDLLLGSSIHRLLPLANIALPLLFSALLLRRKGAAPWLAGLALGTAAYLVSVMVLGQLSTPFGAVLTTIWCAINALACLFLGSLLLRQRTA